MAQDANGRVVEPPNGRVALPLITTSSMRSYRGCPRLYKHSYEDGYAPVREADSLFFGSLTHKWLAVYWSIGETYQTALAFINDQERLGNIDDVVAAKSRALLAGYDARWGGQPLPGPVLKIGHRYKSQVRNPDTGHFSRTFDHGGEVDGIVGKYVLEHKTTSEDIGAGSGYWARLRMDTQVSNYIRSIRADGYEIDGVLYDVIRKPQHRVGKAETVLEFEARLIDAIAKEPDRYYQRGTVVRLEGEDIEAEADLWSVAKQIRESQKTGRWPRNTDHCMHWGRECQFFPVCSGGTSLDDQTLYRKKIAVHEELER